MIKVIELFQKIKVNINDHYNGLIRIFTFHNKVGFNYLFYCQRTQRSPLIDLFVSKSWRAHETICVFVDYQRSLCNVEATVRALITVKTPHQHPNYRRQRKKIRTG